MTNSEILAKIDSLRGKYIEASPDEREQIESEAAKLDSHLQRCYQCGTVLADDHDSWFCSTEHKEMYSPKNAHKPGQAMTWDQMRAQMQRLAYAAKLKKHGYQPSLGA